MNDAPTAPRDGQPLPLYRPVPALIDLPAMEHEILDFWAAHDTFAASLERTRGGTPWTFFEGPPTANGMPGAHHIEARVFKDVFPRFRTMQGYHVERKAGWDCHGLPVELAVERELGFSGKPDIEAYGVAAFNEKCRESVGRHVDAFAQLTTRMGYWVNMDEAYWTMSPSYVESVWWALKQIHSKGLLVEDYRVAPYCPRCGTTLSDHELAQGYQDDTDPSVYVRFPLTSGPLAGKADLLVWTTTPWTLISNTAVAVNPDVTYVVATKLADPEPEPGAEDADSPSPARQPAAKPAVAPGTTLVVAQALATTLLGDGWTLGDTFTGAQMERWRYQRPFEVVDFPPVDGGTNYVILGDFVTTDEGTGLVHEAPAFGEIDMASCRAYGLPMVNPIRRDGTFEPGLAVVGGLFFRDANAPVMADLSARGLLFRRVDVTHSYPHCWRCDTALIYYAQQSWYIRTTAVKDALLRENEATGWYPDTIKHGRYGDWLSNNIDWDLSRTRYWGTPLPIWRCADGHQTCVGSLAELGELAGEDLSALDPHRPFVDDVTLACPVCGQAAHRVPEVIDAWFDSGSMPFAQWGYPWADGSDERFQRRYPADFICEAVDQTRGWFYSLMAVGTLVFDQSSYRNVVCLGHILAEDGRKMSKHLGNILEPIPLMDTHGADAVRWFMACSGSPWAARRVGHAAIQEMVRKVLMTLLNTVSFQSLYARANDWTPAVGQAPAVEDRHVLDRWLVSARTMLVRDVTDALENFDTQRAGTLLSAFIDELSNWYVRRSRRRFWDGEPGALWTLHETLDTLVRLMAPITPFVAERVWQDLVVAVDADAPSSVHLASWPTTDDRLIDERLNAAMDVARRLVELGRAARSESKVKTRQPLSRALVSSTALAMLDDDLRAEVMAELNVERLESFASAGDLVDHSAKGNFRALGRRFGKQTPVVAAAIADADATALAAALAQGVAHLDVPGVGPVELGPDDVLVSERPREGWSVVNEQGETVALDLELTPELRLAGLAREVIRAVQEARKASGFDVSDRITLTWAATDVVSETANAIRAHHDLIADEVLAVQVHERPGLPGTFGDDDLGFRFDVAQVRHE